MVQIKDDDWGHPKLAFPMVESQSRMWGNFLDDSAIPIGGSVQQGPEAAAWGCIGMDMHWQKQMRT